MQAKVTWQASNPGKDSHRGWIRYTGVQTTWHVTLQHTLVFAVQYYQSSTQWCIQGCRQTNMSKLFFFFVGVCVFSVESQKIFLRLNGEGTPTATILLWQNKGEKMHSKNVLHAWRYWNKTSQCQTLPHSQCGLCWYHWYCFICPSYQANRLTYLDRTQINPHQSVQKYC